MNAFCPCGSGETGANCCTRFLAGEQLPATPEALMRSRFTAWHAGNYEYLLLTLHPDARDGVSEASLHDSGAATEWHSLRILDAPAPTDNEGIVEFVAFFTHANSPAPSIEQLHERSAFTRSDGVWYYRSGVFLPPMKTGRNEPCWCGSGKKRKKCHDKT